MPMRSVRAVFVICCILFIAAPARAQYTAADTLQAVVPGLVYKEFTRTMGGQVDWRITDPDATYVGYPGNSPDTWLPNPVLNLNVDDLQGAIRAVAVIDVWGGHVGTSGKQFRLNGNDWIDIPDVQGTATNPDCYMHQLTVEIEVPLEDLVEGANDLEGLSDRQVCHSWGWGQWGWYTFMLRIVYDPATRTPATAAITSPVDGSTLTANPTIAIDAESARGIDRVDVLGRYLDYDHDGDGVFEEWQQSYHLLPGDDAMILRDHVGTARAFPYEVDWDTSWIPDQVDGTIEFVARVKDADGLWTVTDRVGGLSLERPAVNVTLYEPRNVGEKYWVRDGATKSSRVQLPGDDSLNDAVAARIVTRTWNGNNAGAGPGETASTTLNGWTLPPHGVGYAYSIDAIDVPVGELQSGVNTFTSTSASVGHGVEIMWPGPAVLVRYEDYSTTPAFVVAAPEPAFALEGSDVTFEVDARGADPITYQWQRDGVDIVGATQPVLTLAGVTTADDGASLRCVVTNDLGSETSPEATLTVFAPGGPRVEAGQIALYTFEASGDTIFDRSGFGAPLDLVVADASAVTPTPDGLSIEAPVTITSSTDAAKISGAIGASGEITLEAWIQPANLTQNGPARIVSLSGGPLARNVTLGQGVYEQGADRLEVRLRSTESTVNGLPALATANGSLTTALQHVVFTRTAGGTARIFVDGIERARGPALGNLSNWNTSFALALANEIGGDRPWLGTLGLVAFYDRALSTEEIFQNFAAGPTPQIVATSTPASTRFALGANVPNPFNPSTTISFEIPARADVGLAVYDLRGRRVASLVRGSYDAGAHSVRWNGRNAAGTPVSSGVYFYELRATTADGRVFEEARRMLLMK